MPLTITETLITGGSTPHTASYRPHAAADGAGWVVSWLPGRYRRDAAITAMTLAEAVGDGTAARIPAHIDGWADELGLTGPEALRKLSEATLTMVDEYVRGKRSAQ